MGFQELDSIPSKKENNLKPIDLDTAQTGVTQQNGRKPTKPMQEWNEHDEGYYFIHKHCY